MDDNLVIWFVVIVIIVIALIYYFYNQEQLPPIVQGPKNLRHLVTDETEIIRWDPVPNAVIYEISIGESPGKYGEPIPLEGTSYYMRSTACKTYYVAVRATIMAYPRAFRSLLSPEISFKTGIDVPKFVEGNVDSNILTFSWQPVPLASRYKGFITIYADQVIPSIPFETPNTYVSVDVSKYQCSNIGITFHAITPDGCQSRRHGDGYYQVAEGTILLSYTLLNPTTLRLFWNPVGEQAYKVMMAETEQGPPTISFETKRNEVDVTIKPNQIYYGTLQVIYPKCLSVPFRFIYRPK